MSSSLSVYLLDTEATRAFVGSGNEELLKAIRAEFGAEMAADDSWFSSEIADGAPTAYEALRTVVRGGPYPEERRYAFQYGYAYKRLCAMTGQFLDNSSFSPFRGDWLELVDEGLRALRVTAVSVAELGYYGGFPKGVPVYDLPRCGEWTQAQCLEALEQVEATMRDGRAPALEPEIRAAVTDVIGWLRRAQARPGSGVVGFVS
ncbi:hypothetical protein ABZO31_02680 [Streptomyces sp. HUAS MG47]|uniref:DUF7691 family protein n=1 Tax=Streptomyces solicamelliae TaxID=3231716 RepID=UPI0038782934